MLQLGCSVSRECTKNIRILSSYIESSYFIFFPNGFLFPIKLIYPLPNRLVPIKKKGLSKVKSGYHICSHENLIKCVAKN